MNTIDRTDLGPVSISTMESDLSELRLAHKADAAIYLDRRNQRVQLDPYPKGTSGFLLGQPFRMTVLDD